MYEIDFTTLIMVHYIFLFKTDKNKKITSLNSVLNLPDVLQNVSNTTITMSLEKQRNMYHTLIFLGTGRATGIGIAFGYNLPAPRCDTGLGTKTGGLLGGLAGLFCGFLFFGDSSRFIDANFLT